jgi:phosphoribosylaminoimidazole-succinocarboxamide synthase
MLRSSTVSVTAFESLTLKARGKVRDIYDFGDRLMIVATDRISAFDVVMPSPIPDKGRVLTQLSRFWFSATAPTVPNHLISTDLWDFPYECKPYREVLEGRSMLVEKADVFPVECVVRGYLSGSAWEEYARTGEVCGIPLPKGLVESSELKEPIFTPATKAEIGQNSYYCHLSDCAGLCRPTGNHYCRYQNGVRSEGRENPSRRRASHA